MIDRYKFDRITLSGSNGTAGGTVTSSRPLQGRVMGMYVDHSSGTATTDVVFKTAGTPIKTLITITDSITDGWYYPRHQIHGADGAVATLDGTRAYRDNVVINDYVTVTALQGDNGQTLDAWIELETDMF